MKQLSDPQIADLIDTLDASASDSHHSPARCLQMAGMLRGLKESEPVAWCLVFNDTRCGSIYSNPTMNQPEALALAHGKLGIEVVPLFTAPQPAADVIEAMQAKLNAAEARERHTRETLHKFMQNTSKPATVPLPDEWIRARTKQPWIFETVKQWVMEIEAAHGITAMSAAQGEKL